MTGEPDVKDPAPEKEPASQGIFDTPAKDTDAKPKPRRRVGRRKPRAGAKRPTTPREPTKRTDVAESLGMVWGLAGGAVAKLGDQPVGVVMQLQAPDAGKRLNKALQTLPTSSYTYRMVTKFLGKGQLASELGPVILPPLLVGYMERNPAAAVHLMPMLRAQLRPVLIEAAREAARDEQEIARMTGEEAELGTDLDEIIAGIFGWDGVPERGPEPPSPGTDHPGAVIAG